MQTSFTVSTHSDQGLRPNMEDIGQAFQVESFTLLQQSMTVLVVCDGAGGLDYGEVASECGVRSIAQSLGPFLYNFAPPGQSDHVAIISYLRQSLYRANDAVLRRAQAKSKETTMATTAALVVAFNGHLYVAWAGDSRVYLWRQGEIRRLTHDHSCVQQLIDAGQLSPEQAHDHPDAHAITQYLGKAENFLPQETAVPLQPDDIVIVSSDGLTDVLSDQQIGRAIQRHLRLGIPFEHLARHLVDQALAAGTTDNATAVCGLYHPVSNPFTQTVIAGYSLARFVSNFSKEPCHADQSPIRCHASDPAGL